MPKRIRLVLKETPKGIRIQVRTPSGKSGWRVALDEDLPEGWTAEDMEKSINAGQEAADAGTRAAPQAKRSNP